MHLTYIEGIRWVSPTYHSPSTTIRHISHMFEVPQSYFKHTSWPSHHHCTYSTNIRCTSNMFNQCLTYIKDFRCSSDRYSSHPTEFRHTSNLFKVHPMYNTYTSNTPTVYVIHYFYPTYDVISTCSHFQPKTQPPHRPYPHSLLKMYIELAIIR
jgi:hypothetical protein